MFLIPLVITQDTAVHAIVGQVRVSLGQSKRLWSVYPHKFAC